MLQCTIISPHPVSHPRLIKPLVQHCFFFSSQEIAQPLHHAGPVAVIPPTAPPPAIMAVVVAQRTRTVPDNSPLTILTAPPHRGRLQSSASASDVSGYQIRHRQEPVLVIANAGAVPGRRLHGALGAPADNQLPRPQSPTTQLRPATPPQPQQPLFVQPEAATQMDSIARYGHV